MTDSFEKWINSMSEQDYADFVDEDDPDSGTDAQIEKALNIRTPITQQDEDDLDAMQEGIQDRDYSRVEQIQEPEEIYDNRDLPPVTRNVTIEIPRDNSPPRILPRQQVRDTRQPINTPSLPRQPQQPQPQQTIRQQQVQPRMQQPQVQVRPSFTQRIRTSISNTLGRLNPFRRNKK
jgi:hypothetical protein